MDGKNVNELTEVSTLTDDSNMLVGEDNTLKRISFANVKTLLKTIIGNATQAVAGLFSAADKTKLDAMDSSLESKTVETSLSSSATAIPTSSAVNGALADYHSKNSLYYLSELRQSAYTFTFEISGLSKMRSATLLISTYRGIVLIDYTLVDISKNMKVISLMDLYGFSVTATDNQFTITCIDAPFFIDIKQISGDKITLTRVTS